MLLDNGHIRRISWTGIGTFGMKQQKLTFQQEFPQKAYRAPPGRKAPQVNAGRRAFRGQRAVKARKVLRAVKARRGRKAFRAQQAQPPILLLEKLPHCPQVFPLRQVLPEPLKILFLILIFRAGQKVTPEILAPQSRKLSRETPHALKTAR